MEDGTETQESYEWRGLRLRPGRDWDFESGELLEGDGGDRRQYGENLSIRIFERWLEENKVDQAEIQDAWQAMDWSSDPENALDKEAWIALFKAAGFPVPNEAIAIYRAEAGPEGAVGLAWTDKFERVGGWAERHRDERSRHGRSRILKAVAKPGEILAVFGSDGPPGFYVDEVWVNMRHAEIIAVDNDVEEVG